MEQNSKIKWFGLLSLVSIIGLELAWDNALMTLNHCYDILIFSNVLKSSVFYLLSILFILSILINRKHVNFKWSKLSQMLRTLIKNTVSGNLLDIAFVLFFLLHLTWVPDSIFEWVKEDYSVMHPIIYLLGLMVAILVKPEYIKEESKEPLVMLSGVSNLLPPYSNIETLLRPIKENPSIQKIIAFVDPNMDVQIEDYKGEITKENKFIVLHDFLAERTGKEILMVECSYNLIQSAYEIIFNETTRLLSGTYTDKNLLFNLTPGNTNISIALALNSIRLDRRSCYIQQGGDKKLEYETLDIYKLRDVFSEIID